MINKHLMISKISKSQNKSSQKTMNTELIQQKSQKEAIGQSENQVLFTISIGIFNKKSNLDVRKGDDANSLAKRFCKQHSIKESQANIKKIKLKLRLYLKNTLNSSNTEFDKRITQKLRDNIKYFMIANDQQSISSDKRVKIIPNITKMMTLNSENGQKQNLCQRQSQKSKDQQILMMAYQAVFKKSKDPIFKQMAQQYLTDHGKKQLIQEDSPKYLNECSNNKVSYLTVSGQKQIKQDAEQRKISRIRKNFKKMDDSFQQINVSTQDTDGLPRNRRASLASNYHYTVGINQKPLIRQQLYEPSSIAGGKSKKRFIYLVEQK